MMISHSTEEAHAKTTPAGSISNVIDIPLEMVNASALISFPTSTAGTREQTAAVTYAENANVISPKMYVRTAFRVCPPFHNNRSKH